MPRLTRPVPTIILSLVLALVAAPALASTATVTASPGTVTSAGAVGTTVAIPAAGAAGSASQVITQSFDPTHLRLGSASQVTLPEGWTATYSTDGTAFGAAPATAAEWAQVRAVRATGAATGTAATGGLVSQAVPAPPSSSFSGGTGGDGWNVFFDDGGHVFNVWHHNGDGGYAAGQGLGAIDCHTRSGASCGSGWPFYMSATGSNGGSVSRIRNTGVHSPGWVDNANSRLWIPTNDNGTNTGFACVDLTTIATPAWCGGSATAAFQVLGSSGPSGFVDNRICSTGYPWGCVDGIATSGSRIYTTETRTGKILCLDTAANGGLGAACAGQPYTLSGASAAPTLWNGSSGFAGSWIPALLNVDGRIIGTALGSYTSAASPVLFCLAGDTGAACPGWSAPKSLPTGAWLTYAEPDAAGATNGVCVRLVTTTSPAGAPTCFTLAGAAMTGNSAIASTWTQTTTSENASGSAITVGSRVLWGNGDFTNGGPALFCSDAATGATCTGWPRTAYDNYTIVVDPENDSCFWTNSHAGQIAQVSRAGTSGCAGVPPTSATFTATSLVATQRLQCTGAPTWGSLSLTSPAQGTYATATLTVQTAGGAVVSSGGTTWQNVPITSGTLDLASLAQADTGANPKFIVNFTGRTNSNDIATTITAPAYAPQLCTTLIAQDVACPYAGTPTGTLSAWSATITGSGSQAGAAVDATQARVAFDGPTTTACVEPPPSTPVTPRTPRTDPPPPVTTRPRVVSPGTKIVTAVRVAKPGVVTQRGTLIGGGVACTSRRVVVRAAQTALIVCRLRAATIARLAEGPVRLRLTTRLYAKDGGTSSSTRVVTLRWRPKPSPVTG